MFSARGIKLVPFRQKHVMQIIDSVTQENKYEFDHIYEQNMVNGLMSVMNEPDVFLVEYDGKPLAVMGLDGIDSQRGYLWTIFTDHFKENRTRFYRVSPQLIDFFHSHYYRLYVDTWIGNEGIVQWLGWLGFELGDVYETENDHKVVHFVRCNPERKNVYALSSRPVKH